MPKRSRRRRSGVRPDDAILGAIGGVAVTYYGLVAHSFEHPWHWLAAGGGGVVGGVGFWLYADRERLWAKVRRFARERRSDERSQAKRGKRTP